MHPFKWKLLGFWYELERCVAFEIFKNQSLSLDHPKNAFDLPMAFTMSRAIYYFNLLKCSWIKDPGIISCMLHTHRARDAHEGKNMTVVAWRQHYSRSRALLRVSNKKSCFIAVGNNDWTTFAAHFSTHISSLHNSVNQGGFFGFWFVFVLCVRLCGCVCC